MIHESLNDLAKVRLLSYATLTEVWPDQYPPDRAPFQVGATSAHQPLLSPRNATLPSLVDLSLMKIIEQCIASGDASALDNLVCLPGKLHILEQTLRASAPLSDNALSLLTKFICETKAQASSLDLSPFSLSEAQLGSIAPQIDGFHSLNLSGNSNITVDAVRILREKVPSLRRLVVMNCVSIDGDKLLELLRTEPLLFRNMDAVYHPRLIHYQPSKDGHPFIHGSARPVGMSVMLLDANPQNPPAHGFTLPICNPALVVQGLTDLVTAAVVQRLAFNMSSGRVCEVAFTGLLRESSRCWSKRIVVPTLPLDIKFRHGYGTGWLLIISLLPSDSGKMIFLRFHKPNAATSTIDDASQGSAVRKDSVETSTSAIVTSDSIKQEATPTQQERRVKIPDVQYEVHDLRSFLDTTTGDGYTAVAPNTVKALEAVIGRSEWKFMSKEDLTTVIPPTQWS